MLLLVFAAAGSATTAVPPVAFGNAIEVAYSTSDAVTGEVDAIAIGNLNGDSRPDLAVSGDATVNAVLNRGGGQFKTVAAYDAPASSAVAIADVNGDGKDDLLATDGRTVSVLLNHGGGTFLPRVDYRAEPKAAADTAAAIAVGDLNGDGRPDVVTGDDAVTSIAVLLNRGDGTFAPPLLYATASPPADLELGDLNGDGKLDAAVASWSAKVVSVFTGAGNGTLGARTDYAAGGHPQSIALADFNGDGKLDAASGNCCAFNHGISLVLNIGGGSLAAAREYAAGEQWFAGYGGVVLDAADMNGDRRPDFVYLAAPVAEEIRLNRGGGRFEPQLTAPGDWSLDRIQTATGDLNGDGRPDQAYGTLNERNGFWDLFARFQRSDVCDVQFERGNTLAVARRTLALANCRVGRVAYAHTRKVARGLVVSQAPAYGGAVWRKGKRVDLVVSLGR